MSIQQSGERVNKITTRFDGDGVIITLYRTHKKLAVLTNEDIGVEPYQETKAGNKTTYAQYCKETVKNLLENGGIEGYYYDPVNRQDNPDKPKKFTNDLFKEWAMRYTEDRLTSFGLTEDEMEINDVNITVHEFYNDNKLKYADALVSTNLHTTSNTEHIDVVVQLKSGQLSKPKLFYYKDKEMNLNATNISKIIAYEDIKEVKRTTNKETSQGDKWIAEQKALLDKKLANIRPNGDTLIDITDNTEIMFDELEQVELAYLADKYYCMDHAWIQTKEYLIEAMVNNYKDDSDEPDDIIENDDDAINRLTGMIKNG